MHLGIKVLKHNILPFYHVKQILVQTRFAERADLYGIHVWCVCVCVCVGAEGGVVELKEEWKLEMLVMGYGYGRLTISVDMNIN